MGLKISSNNFQISEPVCNLEFKNYLCHYLLNMDIIYRFVKQHKFHNMNISFTKKQEKYIIGQVESGDYQNNSEVIRDALRLHSIYREKVIQDLKMEIEKGWNSPDSSKTMDDIVIIKKHRQLQNR